MSGSQFQALVIPRHYQILLSSQIIVYIKKFESSLKQVFLELSFF